MEISWLGAVKTMVSVMERVVLGQSWTIVPGPPDEKRLLIVVWSPEEMQAAEIREVNAVEATRKEERMTRTTM